MNTDDNIFEPFNLAYIARDMGKSRTWLYLRLFHRPVGRKQTPGSFQMKDLERLKASFRDLARQAENIANKLDDMNDVTDKE